MHSWVLISLCVEKEINLRTRYYNINLINKNKESDKTKFKDFCYMNLL